MNVWFRCGYFAPLSAKNLMLRHALLTLASAPLLATAQSWNWATPIFSTPQSRVEAVAALADGGVLVCGEFTDTLRTTADTVVSHGDQDGFIARMDNAGEPLWLIAIGGDQYDELNDVVVDDNGNAYAACTFLDTVDWNGAVIPGTATREAALVKFDLDGNVLWSRRAVGYSYAYTVSVGDNGIAYLGGVLNTSAVFSGEELENDVGIFNAFIVRYTADDGDLVDANMVSGSSGDFGAYGMDVDDAGNAYITGYSRPQQDPYVGTFMAKCAYGGGTGWTQTVTNGSGDLYGYDVSVAHDGHVYFTGNIFQNVLWMGSPFGQYGRYDNAYLARFSADGTLDWVQHYGGPGTDVGNGVVADGLGSAYWTGQYYGPVSFDTISVVSGGFTNSEGIFVARTEPAGGVAFVSTAGNSSGDEWATCIDKRVDGPVVIAGYYASFQCTFDTILMPSQGRLFVASMGAPDDDLSTALDEQAHHEELQLYPVPAQHTLFVAMPGARGALDLIITDASGRIAHRTRLGAPFGDIDISDLAPGLYTVRCTDASGLLRVMRLVVDR